MDDSVFEEKLKRHVPLIRTKAFQLALGVPLFSGLLIAMGIICVGDVGGVCFSSKCWSNFVNIFKVPIAVSGISLPLVAMVAAIHRSNETFVQIRLSQRQLQETLDNNKFGNYLKHRETFVKSMADYASAQDHGVTVNCGYLYDDIFPAYECFKPGQAVNSNDHMWVSLRSKFNRMYDISKCSDGRDDFIEFIRLYVGVKRELRVAFKVSGFLRIKDEDVACFLVGGDDPLLSFVISIGELLHLYRYLASYCRVPSELKFDNGGWTNEVEELIARYEGLFIYDAESDVSG
ncbi:hypothetical protein ABC668_03605 [Pseudomonas aeruginosa]